MNSASSILDHLGKSILKNVEEMGKTYNQRYNNGRGNYHTEEWDKQGSLFNDQIGKRSPFAGLAIRFEDEDLKYLLTSTPIPK